MDIRPNIKKPSPRSIRLWSNILLILVAGIVLVWKGPGLFAGSADPVFFRHLVYGLSVVGVLGFLWQTYKSKYNTLLTAMIKPALLMALVAGVTFLAGNYLVGFMGVTTDKNCEKLIELADQLSEENDLQGAESLLTQCINQTKAPRYVQIAEIKLAHVYVSEVSGLTTQGICRQEYFEDRLSRALGYAQKYSQADLEALTQDKINDAEQTCSTAIATTPNTTPDTYEIDILRTKVRNDRATMDIRVVKNHDKQVLDLLQENFSLWIENQKIDTIGFSSHNTDDPVCIVAVVDNSGSITDNDGLTKIRSAVQVINTLRKPNDEIALVLFGNPDNINVVREPYNYNLTDKDINKINGEDNLTALWGGVEKALEVVDRCQSPDRYLIVLTDGKDNTNFGDPYKAARDFSSRALKHGVNICTVGIQSSQLEEGPLYLLATGCDYFQAASLAEPSGGDNLADRFHEIIGYVRDFYRIEFSSQNVVPGKQLYLQLVINDQFILEKPISFESVP